MDATAEDGGPASEAELSRQAHEWRIAVEQAVRSAKACGRWPGGLERHLADAKVSRTQWRSVLRDFISSTDPSDYRWTPPNRRYVASGLYLPSVERSGIGEIVIAVDTSGSVDETTLEQFAGEIRAIADETHPERIYVVYCDAEVQRVDEFGANDPIELSPKGGEGTDFKPPFRWVDEQGLDPKCLIYLTDLWCKSFPDPPAYPVLWATDSPDRTAPFGETLRICA
jgi:predicted metal-dependent peptidase